MHILFYNADSIILLSVLIVQRIIDTVIIHFYIPHVQHMCSTYTINTYHIFIKDMYILELHDFLYTTVKSRDNYKEINFNPILHILYTFYHTVNRYK